MMLKFYKDIFKDFRVVNFYKNDFFAYFISRNSYPSHSLSHGIYTDITFFICLLWAYKTKFEITNQTTQLLIIHQNSYHPINIKFEKIYPWIIIRKKSSIW